MKESHDNDVCICHGDIRLDQFIYSDDTLWIIDFEELRKGDPTERFSWFNRFNLFLIVY